MQGVDQQGAEPGIRKDGRAAGMECNQNSQRNQGQQREGRQYNVSCDLFAGLARVVVARDECKKQVGKDNTGDTPGWPHLCAEPEDRAQQDRFGREQSQIEQSMGARGVTVPLIWLSFWV
jgi:hypothetical protein